MNNETLIPVIGEVTNIRVDTPDVKTFRVTALGGGKAFEHIPGQCAMLSIPGAGEAMFSITSSPTTKDYMEFSIKKCGCLTTWLHEMEVGQQITIRGPYGNGFPVDTEFVGKDLLFIAGGIGLAPLHSVINYCRHYRDRYGKIVPCSGNTSIFIYPGIELHAIDGMITNFHLPESTLIMLIAAFYGYDKTMAAYKVAVEQKYRFFSFGDAMFIK